MKVATFASVASGIAANATERIVKRWWLQDTGSGYDLTTKSRLLTCLRDCIEDASVHLVLDTANGTAVAT